MSHYKPILYLFVPALFLGASCTNIATNTNETVSSENTNTTDTSGEVDTSDWLTYTNDEYGFSFRYPSDWEVNALDENTIGLVSPQRKIISSNSPTELNSDFYLVLNQPSESVPYIDDDFKASLEKSEKEGLISDLSFASDSRAIFVEHNDFFDQDQYVQYLLVKEKLIISVAYPKGGKNKQIIENIMNSIE